MLRLGQPDLVVKLASADIQVSKKAKGNKNVAAHQSSENVSNAAGGKPDCDQTPRGTRHDQDGHHDGRHNQDYDRRERIGHHLPKCTTKLKMVVSTAKEKNSVHYVKIQPACIQDTTFEVSAHRTALHATVKGITRGIPVDTSTDKLDSNIVNDRNTPTVPLYSPARVIQAVKVIFCLIK